jgi:membrane protease YdiL (CAAX protease family)
MKHTMMNLLKIVWLIACVAVLVWTFVACGQEANATLRGECSLLAAVIMALLTLPLGLAWWLLLSGAGYFLPRWSRNRKGVGNCRSSRVAWFVLVQLPPVVQTCTLGRPTNTQPQAAELKLMDLLLV